MKDARPGPVAAVLLAAGRSTRYGATKLVTPLGDGVPLVRASADALLAAAVDEVLVVLGHDAEAVREALDGLPVRTVPNPHFARGMGTSVGAGVGALSAATAAALVALGDQPLPGPRVPDRLIQAWRAGAGPIVAPVYRGARGNPVLFDASVFEALRRLDGDRGARDLIDAAPDRVAAVAFDFAAPPDVDTPADLALLASRGSG